VIEGKKQALQTCNLKPHNLNIHPLASRVLSILGILLLCFGSVMVCFCFCFFLKPVKLGLELET
jgi:hypothetical protein